jgi:predicted lipoprotein
MCAVRWLIAIGAIAVIGWLFPLFHVVPLKTAVAEKAAVTFDPTSFAENFWTNQLASAFDKAVKADVLVAAIQADSAVAKKKYSRSVGLSDTYFYFLSGTGQVVAVSDDEVSLALTPGSTNVDVALQAGLVFGDTIRDGTGLLNASDYPDSQNFNDLSAALDHLVETRVLPPLKAQAKVGTRISFIGCAEVDDESSDLKPLKVIPIQTEAQ